MILLSIGIATAEIPPAPTNLQNTTGEGLNTYWINYTWSPGTGDNETDSYNVSFNGEWFNGTTNTYLNKTVEKGLWANITVYAYNNSGAGNLSSGSVSDSVLKRIKYHRVNYTLPGWDDHNDDILHGSLKQTPTLSFKHNWIYYLNDSNYLVAYDYSKDKVFKLSNEPVPVLSHKWMSHDYWSNPFWLDQDEDYAYFAGNKTNDGTSHIFVIVVDLKTGEQKEWDTGVDTADGCHDVIHMYGDLWVFIRGGDTPSVCKVHNFSDGTTIDASQSFNHYETNNIYWVQELHSLVEVYAGGAAPGYAQHHWDGQNFNEVVAKNVSSSYVEYTHGVEGATFWNGTFAATIADNEYGDGGPDAEVLRVGSHATQRLNDSYDLIGGTLNWGEYPLHGSEKRIYHYDKTFHIQERDYLADPFHERKYYIDETGAQGNRYNWYRCEGKFTNSHYTAHNVEVIDGSQVEQSGKCFFFYQDGYPQYPFDQNETTLHWLNGTAPSNDTHVVITTDIDRNGFTPALDRDGNYNVTVSPGVWKIYYYYPYNGTFRSMETVTIEGTSCTNPTISDLTNTTPGVHNVTISWTTDQVTDNHIKYGKNSDLSDGVWSDWAYSTSSPSIDLTGLDGNTTYYYRVYSYNSTNFSCYAVSTINSFTTKTPTWTKKRPIHINNTGGGALTDYEIMINITYNSDMQTDFDDIRVKNESSGEFVPYWIEDKVNGSWCRLWFNASYIPANSWCNDTYYLYYGNPDADYVGNGEEVFKFFDNASINKSSYYSYDTNLYGTVTGTLIYNSTNHFYDMQGLSGGDMSMLKINDVSLSKFCIRAKVYESSNGSEKNVQMGLGRINSTEAWYGRWSLYTGNGAYHDIIKHTTSKQTGYSSTTNLGFEDGVWYIHKVCFDGGEINSSIYYLNGTLIDSATYSISEAEGNPVFYSYQSGGTDKRRFKEVYVRKYASPEPSAELGAEEQQDTSFTVTLPAGYTYAHFNLTGIAGGIAHDTSGNGNDGTIYGAKWVDGKFGSALSFDGEDDYVNCGSDPSLNCTDAITIEAWVKGNSFSSINRIVAKDATDVDSHQAYQLLNVPGGEVYFRIKDNGTWYGGGFDVVLSPGQWYHVVGTYDGEVLKAFVNGVQAPTTYLHTGSIEITADTLKIGGRDEYVFNGIIDEVRIYNRALNETEIQNNYNGSVTRNGLVGEWTFDYGPSSQQNVTPEGQTSTTPFYNITNTGNVNLTVKMKINATIPNVILKADTDNNPSGAKEINTTYAVLCEDLPPNEYLNVWLWTDLSHAEEQETERNLTINCTFYTFPYTFPITLG